ncbi:MAG: hypothetical protein GY869_24890 [Planctomycetes bacterium]|nr:hypothetical protein [Planctomycetota bacterium]
MKNYKDECATNCSCNTPGNDPSQVDRREFLKSTTAAAAAGLSLGGIQAIAGPFQQKDIIDHFIPADKKLKPDWINTLFARGQSTWYSGSDLDTIGMPVGGICAGQLYLTGDGQLAYWGIFNHQFSTGAGQVNYQVGRKPNILAEGSTLRQAPPIDQGFALQVRRNGTTIAARTLDQQDFPQVRFCGEYPIGSVEYPDDTLPVELKLEAFSPFIPLNPADSTLPGTIMKFTVKNTSQDTLQAALTGWLQNAVCLHSGSMFGPRFRRLNTLNKTDQMTSLSCSAKLNERPAGYVARQPLVFADFEGENYGNWKVEGEAFGAGPAAGALPRQQAVSGFKGNGLVNTFIDGDRPHGKLTSPTFKIERPYISFLVGGGNHENQTCINLLIDGKVVHTATGKNNERLETHNWNVSDLTGQTAQLEIVDSASGGWGHINIDQIEFRDEPIIGDGGDLPTQSDYGTMALSVLGTGNTLGCTSCPQDKIPAQLFDSMVSGPKNTTEKQFDDALIGIVGREFSLPPGEETTVTFIVNWHMPNLRRGNDIVGNNYAERFNNAVEVARYMMSNLDRLANQTRLWHDCYYDSTLPYWLLDRLHSTAANLASNTCQWWSNGRFWAWEGCGCCRGTCGHVWNYEHTLARMFPQLQRSVREMQDFAEGVGMQPDGSIMFRGEGWTNWAGDSQAGYILKAYREHLISPNQDFLKQNWNAIKKAMQFLIDQDANDDGLIEGRQHQTYDQDYYGANTMVGSLYLGALRSAEQMAHEIGDTEFAETCRKIFASGSKISVEKLFNGEYFIQEVDLEKYPQWQYGDGCLADHLFGQGWAHQVGLGYLYPPETVNSALQSIWKYCWSPDVGPQNQVHKPQRWFAYPGEAGLFTCTWPKSKHLGADSTRYRNEIWTGIEYQVAGHMAWEGMLIEALAICRGVHERYHPTKHNPFNEIECGDHYARALASWGVLIGLSGFEYNGPAGQLTYAPRITPDNFKSIFTAARGWGSLFQKQQQNSQLNRIELKWGSLQLNRLTVILPKKPAGATVHARLDGNSISSRYDFENDKCNIHFDNLTLKTGQNLEVTLDY